jgi:hypothetical protein
MEWSILDKKALSNIDTVAYDLHKMKYGNRRTSKPSRFIIPKEEIKINPDIKFYDVEQSKPNPLQQMTTTINKSVKANLAGKKIENLTLKIKLLYEVNTYLLITTSNLAGPGTMMKSY